MSYPKIAKIILKLAENTQKGSIKWEETGSPAIFQAAFPGYAVQVWVSRNVDDPQYSDYYLRIIDEEGKIVEEVSDLDLKNVLENPYETMKELCNVARRSALGVENALNSILNSLKDEPPF